MALFTTSKKCMRLSHYLLTYPYPEHPGYLLLFSTKKGSLALLSEKILHDLEEGMRPGKLTDTLRDLGMVVPDPEEEKKEVWRYLDEINRLNPNLKVAVILGLDCNFACRYCYEGTMKGRHAMTGETAEQMIAYIRERFVPGKARLILDFYGGEPLLYTDRIKCISRSLQSFAEKQGAVYEFTLVTNGSLLTEKIAKDLSGYGLKGAKITIDGPASNHNRFRPFKSGKGSFESIIKNVREVCSVTKVGIGGNYVRDTYQAFPSLLEHFEEIGLGPDKISQLTFHPVMQITDEFSLAGFHGGCESRNEPWLVDAALPLREEIIKRGYKTPKMAPSPCMVDVKDAFTVHYDGTIYKCIGLIGHSAFIAGDIWKGMNDYRTAYQLDHWKEREECRECQYLPLCFGGCRYMNYQQNGNLKGVDCQRRYLDAALESLLKLDVKYRCKQ